VSLHHDWLVLFIIAGDMKLVLSTHAIPFVSEWRVPIYVTRSGTLESVKSVYWKGVLCRSH
jgi:hypothetical protein